MTMAPLYYVKKVNDDKGYGLFASEDIGSGEVILEEDPLVSAQFSWNKLYQYKACDYCMRSLESAEEMCRRLAANPNISLPHPECCLSADINVARCHKCEEVYCSQDCLTKASNEYHKILCPASGVVDPTSLAQLDETWRGFHYPPETATIQLLVRLLARLSLDKDETNLTSLVESFCHHSFNTRDEIAHKLLGEKFQEQMVILREQLSALMIGAAAGGVVGAWLSAQHFPSLFALLGLNQQGIGTSSFSEWVKRCDQLTADSPLTGSQKPPGQLDQFIDSIYEQLENVAGSFLDCEGAGLYSLQSKCNHSCVPNAQVCFLHRNHRLTLQATSDIAKDSEIFISYLAECDASRSRYSRQRILRENYLFNCRCTKCVEEEDQADETSSDEDDDEDMSQ